MRQNTVAVSKSRIMRAGRCRRVRRNLVNPDPLFYSETQSILCSTWTFIYHGFLQTCSGRLRACKWNVPFTLSKDNPYTLLRINLTQFSVSFGSQVFKRVILPCFFLQSHHKCSTTAKDVLKITTNPGSLLLQTIMLMITKNVHGAN